MSKKNKQKNNQTFNNSVQQSPAQPSKPTIKVVTEILTTEEGEA